MNPQPWSLNYAYKGEEKIQIQHQNKHISKGSQNNKYGSANQTKQNI